MLKSWRVRGWIVVIIGAITALAFALADALGFGYGGFGLVQALGLVWGLTVATTGSLMLHRKLGSRPGTGYRTLVAGSTVLPVVLLSVVVWGMWDRAGDLNADQIVWCDDAVFEMYDAAVELELVTLDEVVDLLLTLPRPSGGILPSTPEPTRDGLLRLFETDPGIMNQVAAVAWWRFSVQPRGEVYKKACKEAYATASIDGLPAPPGDSVNCDFDTPAEAQEWFDTHFRRYGDLARLDRDGDGVPCEDAGWHIDLLFGLAPDNVTHGVEWGPDGWLSDMRSGDSCASGEPWVPPEPDFPFGDISVAIYGNPSYMVSFSFSTTLSPRGAWVHLADGTCLTADDGERSFYQFDDALPEFDRTVP